MNRALLPGGTFAGRPPAGHQRARDRSRVAAVDERGDVDTRAHAAEHGPDVVVDEEPPRQRSRPGRTPRRADRPPRLRRCRPPASRAPRTGTRPRRPAGRRRPCRRAPRGSPRAWRSRRAAHAPRSRASRSAACQLRASLTHPPSWYGASYLSIPTHSARRAPVCAAREGRPDPGCTDGRRLEPHGAAARPRAPSRALAPRERLQRLLEVVHDRGRIARADHAAHHAVHRRHIIVEAAVRVGHRAAVQRRIRRPCWRTARRPRFWLPARPKNRISFTSSAEALLEAENRRGLRGLERAADQVQERLLVGSRLVGQLLALVHRVHGERLDPFPRANAVLQLGLEQIGGARRCEQVQALHRESAAHPPQTSAPGRPAGSGSGRWRRRCDPTAWISMSA